MSVNHNNQDKQEEKDKLPANPPKQQGQLDKEDEPPNLAKTDQDKLDI